MCGIAGIALTHGARRRCVSEGLLAEMGRVLSHRGPDDSGLFIDPSRLVGLAHRRLSIVDVAGGHQPMSNEDGSVHIVYNGEVYNHVELRRGLEASGHCYRTSSDTETILHLYEEEGPRVVESLRGMFALAIWDEAKRELLLARDRLGIKPLYYVLLDDGSLYFASEIKSLIAAEAIKPELNLAGLPDYLANHATTGEETLFASVRRLLPGHILQWRDGEIRVQRYWNVSFAATGTSDRRDDREYVEEWKALFESAVRLRLMADVPLGMFLSGGIDSSAIAAVMSRIVDGPVKTFSVAFQEREANELEYARLVARAFRTDHNEVLISPQEFFAALPRLVWHEDEPLAHPSSVALYFVSRLASEQVKVVLTGEGSDELLAGYERYRKTIWNLALGACCHRTVGRRAQSAARRAIDCLPVGSRMRQQLSRTFLYLPPDLMSLYFENFAVFPRWMQSSLLTAGAREQIGSLDPYAHMQQFLEATDADTLLNQLLYLDTKTYLHELLMKQDQMSMAASIESRVPFLDHQLVEFSARLPEHLKLSHGRTTKRILRKAMEGILPRPILDRRKMGFPVPVGAWFRGPYRWIVDEYVLGERAAQRGWFDRAYLNRIVAEHQEQGVNHAERLWSLVNFEIWQRQFLDGEDLGRPYPVSLQAASPGHRLLTSSRA